MVKLNKIIFSLLIILMSLLIVISNNIKAGLKTVSKMRAHLKAMIKLKAQNQEILNKLMEASFSYSNIDEKINNNITPTLSKKVKKFFRLNPSLKKRFSEVPEEEKDKEIYEQYRYKSYSKIVNHIYELEKKYPNLVKISIAQDRYKLPYPGGKCDNGNQKEK